MCGIPQTQITIIVVAAGSGSRYGSSLPKQFCLLEGRPVLMHTLDALRSACPEARIIVVLSPSMTAYWRGLCSEYGFASPEICPGGDTRWHSVRNAVGMCSANGIILVHDGARPLVDGLTVHRVIGCVRATGAAIPAVAVTDSLRMYDGDGSHAVDRSRYCAVQTPQGFDAALLKDAYGRPYSSAFTDDASVVEAAGHTISLVDGAPSNIKITNPGDIDIAALLMRRGGTLSK